MQRQSFAQVDDSNSPNDIFYSVKFQHFISVYIGSLMTPSNGNIFRVTGLLYEEFTGDRWIPLTKASDAELWCFIWSGPEQTIA